MNIKTQQHPDALAFQEASFIIDKSGVAKMVENWMRDDEQQPSLTELDIHNVLTGWLAIAFARLALNEANVARMLQFASVEHEATEADVRIVIQQVLHVMDYCPLPQTDSALTKAGYEGAMQAREADAELLAKKRRRHLEFTNAILREQLDSTGCSEDKMSVAFGSVFRAAGVEGIGVKQYKQMDASELVSVEPDAGFAMDAPEKGPSGYGWQYEVATLVSSDLLRQESVPNIVVGIAGHKPHQHAKAVSELVHQLFESGRSLEHVTGDLAYFPSLRPECAMEPLREHGAKVVMAYAPTDEGRFLAAVDDSILVEGRWYRRDIPASLRTAMKDFRAASKGNRTMDGSRVLCADVQQRLEEQRDALLDARRAFEVRAPSSAANKYEQEYAYGSTAWTMAFSEGRLSNERYEKAFRDADASLTTGAPSLSGEAAHGFITTLVIATANKQLIAEWKLYHSLDEGNGLMVDEWYAMYHLLVPRIQEGMARWSSESQPDAASAHWNIDNIEDTFGWRPDGAATVITLTRATEELADSIADALLHSLRAQARFLEDESEDLSREARIELALDFVDADRHGGDDGTWLPVPADGAPFAAEAMLVWSEV